MRAKKVFGFDLKIDVERDFDRTAKSGVLCNQCIDKMRREPRRIETMSDWRRFLQKRLLVARDHAQLHQTRERALVLCGGKFRMSPRIETSRRLRQTGEINRFGQSQIACRFSKVRTRGGFGTEPPIAVAAAVQIFRENLFLAPTPLDFPCDDRFINLADPTTALPSSRDLHQLLGDG